jgi:hypothetical protein
MRRLLVLTSVLLLAAGCSTDKSGGDPAAAPAPAPAPAGNSAPAAAGTSAGPGSSAAAKGGDADADLRNNTAAICNQASKTSGDFAATLDQNTKLASDAASAKDEVAKQRAEQKMTRDVQNYSYALIDMSKLAGDQTVSIALKGLGDQVAKFTTDAAKMDAKQLADIRASLDKACGR